MTIPEFQVIKSFKRDDCMSCLNIRNDDLVWGDKKGKIWILNLHQPDEEAAVIISHKDRINDLIISLD